jgi:hypothetical protein
MAITDQRSVIRMSDQVSGTQYSVACGMWQGQEQGATWVGGGGREATLVSASEYFFWWLRQSTDFRAPGFKKRTAAFLSSPCPLCYTLYDTKRPIKKTRPPRARFDFPNPFSHIHSPRLGAGRRASACSSSCSNLLLPLPAGQHINGFLTTNIFFWCNTNRWCAVSLA